MNHTSLRRVLWFLDIFAQRGDQIDRVFNLVQLCCILFLLAISSAAPSSRSKSWVRKLGLVKDLLILTSKIKDRTVICRQIGVRDGVSIWPLIVVDREVEQIGIEQITNCNSPLHQCSEISGKQETGHEVVLVLHNIFYHVFNCDDLIIQESVVYGRSKVKLFWVVRFLNFVFVEKWELLLEVH